VFTRSACGSRPVASGAQATPCDVNPTASDFAMRAMNAIHRGTLGISGGRLGWKAVGMPMLELRTVGRKSGEARATMLSLPLQFGESVIVVASRGGDDKHPAWYLNLVEHPEVEVVLGGRPRETRIARVAIPAERERLSESGCGRSSLPSTATMGGQHLHGHGTRATYQRPVSPRL